MMPYVSVKMERRFLQVRSYLIKAMFLKKILSGISVACLTIAVSSGYAQATPLTTQDQPLTAQDQAPPQDQAAAQPDQAPPDQGADDQGPPPPATLSTDQLNQLVAPIALYPDALVAQILAASAYPTQIVEEERFIQQNPNLKDKDLADAVNKQDWDPSVKALAQFPSVLANMDKNLSWTSSLGDAYVNQQQDVMDAVQTMRAQAQKAGHLSSNEQENVTTEGNTIAIEPATPDVVYVPAYDPWLVYGYPIVAYPGWYPYPGIFYDGPGLFFGVGFGIGFFRGVGVG